MPPETAEPIAGNMAVPVWLMVLLFVLLYGGMVFFDRYSGWFDAQVYMPYTSLADLQACQPRGGGISLERGRAVYENICGLCHNSDGKGKPAQAPPFVGSQWVLGSPDRLIRIPLSGLSGPVQVEGAQWNLSMPAMGAALPDDDLAAVLTYIRQSWGNKASAITPEQVKAARAQIGVRSQPWTAEQLMAVP
jgi:mono/diheme cytochrome c family protein